MLLLIPMVSEACPKLAGEWSGICTDSKEVRSKLYLIIEQNGCSSIRIKRFENDSAATVSSYDIGVPTGVRYFFNPPMDGSTVMGGMGYWRSERTFEAIRHTSSAIVGESPSDVTSSFNRESLSMTSEGALTASEEWWSIRVAYPDNPSSWPSDRQYFTKACPLQSVKAMKVLD